MEAGCSKETWNLGAWTSAVSFLMATDQNWADFSDKGMAPKVTKLDSGPWIFNPCAGIPIGSAFVTQRRKDVWSTYLRTKKRKKHRQETPEVSSVAGLQRIFTWSGIQTAWCCFWGLGLTIFCGLHCGQLVQLQELWNPLQSWVLGDSIQYTIHCAWKIKIYK